MKFSYKFSNLLGTVYRKGNLTFTPDGNTIISPVGNRLTFFDLKNNKSETLSCECELNITTVALSPDGNLLIAVNEEGEAVLVSLRSRTVLHRYHFHRQVHCISFSPDGRKFAVTKENTVLMFHAPGKTREFNPFVLERTFYGAYDESVSIDWTSDSSAFCVGNKDMTTRVYGAAHYTNLIIYSLGGHTDSIVNAFFKSNSLDIYSISHNGQLCVWQSDTNLDQLILATKTSDSSDDEQEDNDEDSEKKKQKEGTITDRDKKQEGKVLYKRIAKHSFKAARGEGAPPGRISSAAYHKQTHILVSGFEDGAFFLHEMPDFNLIHSLSICDQSISAVQFNKTGDWLALGCSSLGQLLVWEWQSESYVLKQQGHFNNMQCLAYSPDGQYIVSGGNDAKVKVWNTSSGFCFVTFNDHLSGITGVAFTQNGQAVLSSSLDGTVRAFDLNRYRNFRTFTSPRSVQFSCLAVDSSGEIVCAGGRDTFEIFVWSMQTGRLLEILAGHTGPISCLAFAATHTILVSGAWDKTLKLWDVFESRGAKETITLNSDVLAVTYRPDGKELAAATLNSQISFWNAHTAMQTGSIEGRHDLGYTRSEGDKISAKKAALGKAFSTLCYSADGQCVLAAGRSNNVCIYSVADQLLIKKFEITCNRSLDGTQEFLDRQKMTEWGSLAMVDEQDSTVSLPGVRSGDMSSRHWRPEVQVGTVRFSPTGREWAATTTEGLLIYALDNNLVFDPFDLEMDIVPENVVKMLDEQEYSTALMLAFRLNENHLIQRVLEQIPVNDVRVISMNLPAIYVHKLLAFIGRQLDTTRHIEFYVRWCRELLFSHGAQLKVQAADIRPALRSLRAGLSRSRDALANVCDSNRFTIDYLLTAASCKRKNCNEQQREEVNAEEAEDEQEEEGAMKEVWDDSDDELNMAELMS